MRILITNWTLGGRTGTETYVRDLALGLMARGHAPVVYSPVLGPIAQELRDATIPVVDNLARVVEAPDVIHAQHRHETMEALLHFPGVPAAYFCHDWHAWQDLPPVFPRIRRYVAVDETRRDRLVLEAGVPPERIQILPNGVDTARFQPRRPLPEKPERALVFSSYVRSEHQVRGVREACRRAGISLEVVGSGVGRSEARPEDLLNRFDLVFAMGRSALEAMAVGTGVVVWGLEGLGGFVRRENFPRLLSLNFGRRALHLGGLCDLDGEIARYDRREAEAVQGEVRQRLNLDAFIGAHLRIYGEVLREEAARGDVPELELQAAADYLLTCEPRAAQETARRKRGLKQARLLRKGVDGGWLLASVCSLAAGGKLVHLAWIAGDRELSLGALLGTAVLLASAFLFREALRARFKPPAGYSRFSS